MGTTIEYVDRGTIRADLNFVRDGHVVATASNPDPDLAYEEFAVWNLVVDHPEATVLWDTGAHPEAGDGYWPAPLCEAFAHVDAADHTLEEDLAGVGYGVEDVDAVVMSHLHLDHAGGLRHFEGTDVPVYAHRDEIQYAYYSGKTDEGSVAYYPPDFDRGLNWQAVGGDRQLFDGFELLHLPGHTPGLLGARIDHEGGTLLVAGDEVYLEANYEGESMAASLLWDNRAPRESLQRLRDVERRTGADVLFGHDPDQRETFAGGWPQ